MYPSTKKVNTTFIWLQVFSIILFVFYVPVIYLEDFTGRSFDVTSVPDCLLCCDNFIWSGLGHESDSPIVKFNEVWIY